MKIVRILLVIIALSLLWSCGEKPQTQPTVPVTEMKSSMETANRYLLNEEEEDIKNYIARHGLEMESTGTGLRYQIIKQGSDKLIEFGQSVSMEYELHSIAGDLIYSSVNDGVKTFVVGGGTVESGLDEAMQYFHFGDYGKVIIPFHLAFGLHGDDNKIPEYATLIYTIKIKDIQ